MKRFLKGAALVLLAAPLAVLAAPPSLPPGFHPGRPPVPPRFNNLGHRPVPAPPPQEGGVKVDVPPPPHEGICAPEEPEASGEPQEKSVADAVFAHVSNESVIEFPNPFTGQPFFEAHLWQCKRAFNIPWLDLSLSKQLIWLWAGSLLLLMMLTYGKPTSMTPRGFPMAMEMLVLFVRDELSKNNIPGEEYRRYTPYLCSIFFFILVMNLLGIVPYAATPTGNIMVTCALSLCTFVLTQIAAIRAAGVGGFLKHLTGGTPPAIWIVMIPVEILGIFTKPFALTIRLFANMIAGHIVIFFMLGLIFIFHTALVATVAVPFAVAVYLLEIFVAFVQAYVFALLSAVFIGMAVGSGHHEEHAAEHAAH